MAAGSNTISAFNINPATGNLTVVVGSPFAAGTNPFLRRGRLGREARAYVANFGSNNVSVYNVNASTGGLMEVDGSPFATGTAPASIAAVPEERRVVSIMANYLSNNISAFSENASTET